MIDNEIIKALKCCCEPKQMGCTHCSVSYECIQGELNIGALVLDLINRQKAVNKLQAKQIVDLKIKVEQQRTEIEQWKEEANKYQTMWCETVNDIQTAQAKATKKQLVER